MHCVHTVNRLRGLDGELTDDLTEPGVSVD
jgi:hypothetical protein